VVTSIEIPTASIPQFTTAEGLASVASLKARLDQKAVAPKPELSRLEDETETALDGLFSRLTLSGMCSDLSYSSPT